MRSFPSMPGGRFCGMAAASTTPPSDLTGWMGCVKASERRRKTLEDAWVGDAVLSLYARRTILRDGGSVDNTAFRSNWVDGLRESQRAPPKNTRRRLGRRCGPFPLCPADDFAGWRQRRQHRIPI